MQEHGAQAFGVSIQNDFREAMVKTATANLKPGDIIYRAMGVPEFSLILSAFSVSNNKFNVVYCYFGTTDIETEIRWDSSIWFVVK